jgi:hypothetical protein
MSRIAERRIEQEWILLERLATENPAILEVRGRRATDDGHAFFFMLHGTESLLATAGRVTIVKALSVAMHFRSLFPAVPIEASVSPPVFHPNVHPDSGFACLWNRFSAGDTIVEAVAQLQRVLTWRSWNEDATHVMQPAAVAWVQGSPDVRLPLSCVPIVVPRDIEDLQSQAARPSAQIRRRLQRA